MLINKEDLDNLMRITKKYYETGDTDILAARHAYAHKLAKASQERRGQNIDWLAFADFACCIFQNRGLAPKATPEMVYNALAALGHAVIMAEAEESADGV